MFCPDKKMKINKFVLVGIPRPDEYARRYGMASVPNNQYSGDADVPPNVNKVEQLAMAEAYDKMMQKVELDRESSSKSTDDVES